MYKRQDYHRYHFPLSGVIRELHIIPGDDALGGKITWEPDLKQYVVDCSVPGWQSIETRGLAIICLLYTSHIVVIQAKLVTHSLIPTL